MNACTNEDLHAYFVRVPSNRLELWAWLESDRLLNPVFREFYTERDVVYEERRLRTEATPLGKFDEEFGSLYWEAHPYKWPVIGWPSDIPTYTMAQAKEYFATYYAPDNLTGVLVGDFKTAEVKPLLERYFGRLPRRHDGSPAGGDAGAGQLGEKRYLADAETSPTRARSAGTRALRPQGHARARPALRRALGPHRPALQGAGGGPRRWPTRPRPRWTRRSTRAASWPSAVKDGKDPAAAEQALFEEIERLQKDVVPAEELQKVKNQAKANAYRRLASPFFDHGPAPRLRGPGRLALHQHLRGGGRRRDRRDLQRVARKYLTRENRTVGVFLRKEGAVRRRPRARGPARRRRAW